ncbi:MAG: hypothetical protein KKC30_12270 [Proteobacteria bacterium]|nr:hypothetical protein [Pseudomonadota bacterium]MBU4277508.1 hypothetical protein [Pseudomonadota bacterium]MBU4384480.1 hypothetical protein [Pseudomonadota bacterium]MBU4605436.1 hypothetical protein [Pseudomonadota bacterium]MCG2766371.1 hypothetical protein [Desulfarculaceae bacterium]
MKHFGIIFLALAFCLALAPLGALAANQLPSCADLEEMANTLDQAAEALAKVGNIERGSELDKNLGQLINALADVANTERNQEMANAVNLMGDSWKKDDWEPMKEGLDNVIAVLDKLIKRDCH